MSMIRRTWHRMIRHARPALVLAGRGVLGVVGVLGVLGLAAQPACAQAAVQEELPALNIDIAETSVSGISSGGFMAVQFQVAHSAIVKGAGVVAAGPYECSQGSALRATTQCSCTLDAQHALCAVGPDSAAVPRLVEATRAAAAAGRIDATENLARQRVFMFAGGKDETVPVAVVRQLADYYRALEVPEQNRTLTVLSGAGHTMPTRAFGNACAVTDSPYLGKCGVDAARDILAWIYGPLRQPLAKAGSARKGRFIQFDQAPYVTTSHSLWFAGMDRTGWVYVPASCARGAPCRLHIALHGCRQGQSFLPLKPPAHGGLYYGTTFVRHAGYDAWADANDIVVLFPQAVSIPTLNPNGCWDWWGYSGADYATQDGVQIASLRAMVARLTAGRRSEQ